MSAKRTGRLVSYLSDELPPGRMDVARVRGMSDAEVERIAAKGMAGLPDDFWDHAKLVMPILKQPISLRVDEDVLAWFRSTGPRYQTRMNAVLRSYMQQVAPKVRRKRGSAKAP